LGSKRSWPQTSNQARTLDGNYRFTELGVGRNKAPSVGKNEGAYAAIDTKERASSQHYSRKIRRGIWKTAVASRS
jgi:hypothetical protein